ncbi:putative membrane protein [Paracoccus alcaliphilus]|uniref:Putative membrane protein n=1 Tax=Paracoccus alcaliphilus TaxID=34002 RepID=A0A1H8LX70_9RHOB|nr:cytochrome c oxidase assembly protein [Paracoccus alcaliphilus]WCR20586.1 cytochrome c oxidase assembly protein [Paracoccus alcaliphilus]SEO09695.1 putative membrane protein [Paracoccus alcaliphilus]
MILGETGTNIPYCGAAPVPAAIWSSWNLDPVLIAVLAAGLLAGVKHATRPGLFAFGWVVLALAFVSPLCALTTALFSARTIHHLLIVSLAMPVLALALPWRSLPAPIALCATAFALILWHIPSVYSAAWNSSWVYWLMQFAMALPAWAFWSQVLNWRGRDAGTFLANALMVGFFAAVMGLIGAVLTFSTRLLYPEHLAGPVGWGMEPLADQQLAGLIMWVPGLLPLAMIAAFMARRAWQQQEQAA